MPCFSAGEFEHELTDKKVELGKDDENPSSDHKSKIVGPLSMRGYL